MASCNWEKFKGGTESKAVIRHSSKDEREKTNHTNKDIDTSKTNLNMSFGNLSEYSKACKAYDERIGCLDKQPGANKRKDRVTLVGLVIPSPEGMDDVTARAWFTDVHEIVCDMLGDDNVIGGSVHFDEVHEYRDAETKEIRKSRSHLHEYVVPELNGKLNAKKFTSRTSMIRMNNQIEKMTREKYPEFKFMDGSKKKSHKSVEELKQESDKAEIVIQAQEKAKEILRQAEIQKFEINRMRKELEKDRENLMREKENFTLEQEKWKREANTAVRETQKRWEQQKKNSLAAWQREADEFKDKVDTMIKETYETSYKNSLQLYQEIQDRKLYDDYKKIVSEMNRSGMTFKGEPILEYFKKKAKITTFNSSVSTPPVMVEKPSVRRFTFSEDDDSKNNDFDDFLF